MTPCADTIGENETSPGKAKKTVKILIVDDHPVMHRGLTAILSAETDMEVIGEACDGASGVRAALACRPDVITMDMALPDMTGTAAIKQIRARAGELGDWSPQIIALSSTDDDDTIVGAIEAGACGYLVMSSQPDEIVDAVRKASAGQSIFALSVAKALARQARRSRPAQPLSNREDAVLQLMAKGLPNAQIAQRLVLEQSTVKTHVEHIFKKLGACNRTQAVAMAREFGLIHSQEALI